MQEQKTMKAIVLDGPLKFSVQELPIPRPASGEVLIKVMAAPINPSDLIFLHQGAYEHKKAPCVPGFQGSGVVLASGGGLMGWGLVNKRVAFTPTLSSGTYSQYALAKSSQCMPIEQSLSFQHASMSFVNPLTAIALLQLAKEKKAKTVIVNAAASSLGRMLNRLIPQDGINIINIVRKEEQVEILRKEGANFILNSSQAGFDEKLKEMAGKMEAIVCFDAIGGQMTGRMLRCMPKESTIYVYGALEGPSVSKIDVKDFIYSNATVTGFFLPHWLEKKGVLKLIPTMLKLRKLLRNELKSDIALECSLDQFEDSVKWYTKNMTKGKVILKPYSESKLNQTEAEVENRAQERILEEKEDKKNEENKQQLKSQQEKVEKQGEEKAEGNRQ